MANRGNTLLSGNRSGNRLIEVEDACLVGSSIRWLSGCDVGLIAAVSGLSHADFISHMLEKSSTSPLFLVAGTRNHLLAVARVSL